VSTFYILLTVNQGEIQSFLAPFERMHKLGVYRSLVIPRCPVIPAKAGIHFKTLENSDFQAQTVWQSQTPSRLRDSKATVSRAAFHRKAAKRRANISRHLYLGIPAKAGIQKNKNDRER